nr:MsnO8 family LLM class oxidoreductase [Streptacidiphilus rugosus]
MPTMVSILDRAHARQGVDASTTLRDTVRLAQEAELLGYHRFWLAEHHGVPGILGSAPTVLAAAVAEATAVIRVGTGGVMLPGHRPMVVAEQFGVLDALFPGRIDMGVGRSLGFTPTVRKALGQQDADFEQFGRQLGELLGWLTGTQSGYPGVAAYPSPGQGVQPFVLALDQAAGIASAAGLPLVIGAGRDRAKLADTVVQYRDAFQPSPWRPEPHVILAASVAIADTPQAAERMLHSEAWSIAHSRTGGAFLPLMPAERIASLLMTSRQRDYFQQALQGFITGADEQVAEQLSQAVTDTGADEILVTTNTHDLAERANSYQRLARLAALTPRPPQPAAGRQP